MGRYIGQILAEMGVLNDWQIAQIVEHQQVSRQKFGQIAVGWGWVQPWHVWEAWARQLAAGDRIVDLDELGYDTAAVEKVPPALVREYRVVPVRTWGDNLVLAVSERVAARAREELPAQLEGHLYFCLARDEQVEQYIASLPTYQTV